MSGRVVVFAGQGAQFVGMGRDLAAACPRAEALYRSAGEILGYDLAELCFDGPLAELTRSDRCQPAVFVTSAAAAAALMEAAPGPRFVGAAGLSLGEWTALYFAGTISFAETVRVLAARGRFMQEACEERQGAMISVIGLSRERVESVAAGAGVSVSNLNCADQIVLSGDRAGIEAATAMAREAGARRVVALPVAGAYHSPLMESAARRLAEVLAGVELKPPSIPVLSNVTGRPHGDAEAVREAMVRQVTSPVQWLRSVEWFRAAGVDRYVECGPGRVVSGLIRRIDGAASLDNVQDCGSLAAAASRLREDSAG